MKGKKSFTREESEKIRLLINQKVRASKNMNRRELEMRFGRLDFTFRNFQIKRVTL